jgi:hypothetical protein
MHHFEELLHCKGAFWRGQCSNFSALEKAIKSPDNDSRHSNSRFSYGPNREMPIKTSRQALFVKEDVTVFKQRSRSLSACQARD